MFDLISLIKTAGYFGIFGMVFAESGLFFGFFFPGDSLLFTAGFLASQGFLNLKILVLGCFIGTILGNIVGYVFGRKIGPRIFTKEDSLFFHKNHLEKARIFYEDHGAKTIVLARFVPFVRTFAPIAAGIGKMDWKIFLFYNIVGGIIWALGVTLIGYYLGEAIPGIDRYLFLIIGLIIAVSLLPAAVHFLKRKLQ